MSEVIKNSVTGLYNLKIDNRVFESEYDNSFAIQAEEIESVLISTLPLNVMIELTKPNEYLELYLKRIDVDLVDVSIYEVEGWMDQAEYLSQYFYYTLKEEIIRAVDSGKTKIEFHDIDHDGDLFEYAMRFSAITIGEAYQRAMEINKSIYDRMIQVCKQGGNYMRLVANSAFQIDVSHIFSGKDKNSTV